MKRLAMVLAIVAVTGCGDRTRGMDTRTFTLGRLDSDQALTLLTPYVSEGGMLSAKGKLITVREKPDRMKVIEGLLAQYDGGGEAVDVALHFQVVQANGFTQRDSALTDIEPMLHQTFRYHGYKLLGETQVRVREEGTFEQNVGQFSISGRVHRMEAGPQKRLPMEIQLRTAPHKASDGSTAQDAMETTVTTTLGKPMVLGQSTSGGAIILVIRPSLAAM